MNKGEFRSWLKTDEESFCIQMPNEIFEDFDNAGFKSFNHKCFAYAYYYLISYLYRNALYGTNTDQYSQAIIIKTFTGNKTLVSYITKNEGLLDSMGYTKTTTNYPVMPSIEDGVLSFALIKDIRKKLPSTKINHSPAFWIKEPVKGFARFDGEDFTGTFYSYQNTHRIDIEHFIEIIYDKQLGHVGLYIYGYIKMMCDRFPNGFQVTNKELGEIVGCSDRTIQNYTQRLEALCLLESTRRFYDNKLLHKVYAIK